MEGMTTHSRLRQRTTEPTEMAAMSVRLRKCGHRGYASAEDVFIAPQLLLDILVVTNDHNAIASRCESRAYVTVLQPLPKLIMNAAIAVHTGVRTGEVEIRGGDYVSKFFLRLIRQLSAGLV